MPLVQTRGAASAQGFGEFAQASAIPNYIEDMFSCFLYTGNGATQTITNGIDLSTKGGLVWLKNRTGGSGPHNWYTTDIGSASYLDSSQPSGLATYQEALSTYNSNGFSLSSGAHGGNENTFTYASWTFRKQPKFFDVVTYTGDGAIGHSINHNLGSTPGCIIFKRTDSTGDWAVYHRSIPNPDDAYVYLNSTSATIGGPPYIVASVGSSSFTLGSNGSGGGNTITNASGGSYVAYLFAHNAGGFGLTGTDNVISCGSFTTDGSGNATVNLGYEPQWLMVKASSAAQSWYIEDSMRGFNLTSRAILFANLANAEATGATAYLAPNSTGFAAVNGQLNASTTYIYIAIRRGPMKVPTLGTSVYSPNAYTGTGAVLPITGMGFPPDFLLTKNRPSGNDWCVQDKLRGPSQYLSTDTTGAEINLGTAQIVSIDQNGVTYGNGSSYVNFSGSTYINLSFRRAPSFFDEVCYTGTGAGTVAHGLGAVPEMIICKRRSGTANWAVYHSGTGATKYLILNQTSEAYVDGGPWNNTTPTASVFSVGGDFPTSYSGSTYVAYLFATCAGVSKVGSYTGTGALQTVNCGFTGGARFVLIKRTDSTGNWWVYDSARGITSGNDPYLYLNSTAAEVTGTNYVDTDSTGFKVTAAAPAELNANGGTYIFLAIA